MDLRIRKMYLRGCNEPNEKKNANRHPGRLLVAHAKEGGVLFIMYITSPDRQRLSRGQDKRRAVKNG